MNCKKIFIMGDSYSTYGGYIPAGYHTYYSDGRTADPIVNGVQKTWWKILARENNLEIVLNDSFSGSTVCNTVRETLSPDSSFVNRFDKYKADDFFTKNSVDTILIFGGTNDSWINSPVGNLKYSDWTEEELKSVLPAFCYLFANAKKEARNIIVIINSGLKKEITDGISEACKYYEIDCIALEGVDKLNGHPTELGMEQISKQIAECMNKD